MHEYLNNIRKAEAADGIFRQDRARTKSTSIQPWRPDQYWAACRTGAYGPGPYRYLDGRRARQLLHRPRRGAPSDDPDTVIATMTEAFGDNEAPAAPIGLDGDELSLAVLVPAGSTVPERMPATTQAGNLTRESCRRENAPRCTRCLSPATCS